MQSDRHKVQLLVLSIFGTASTVGLLRSMGRVGGGAFVAKTSPRPMPLPAPMHFIRVSKIERIKDDVLKDFLKKRAEISCSFLIKPIYKYIKLIK